MAPARSEAERRLAAGGLLTGFGLGGLLDGILLHHVLQWHGFVSAHMPRDTLEGLSTNVLADGLFHLSVLVVLLAGVLVLRTAWRSGRPAPGEARRVSAFLIVGWGGFHVLDQLVVHELLGLHDIRQGVVNAWLYNWTFFALGVALWAAGWALLRR